MLYILEFPQTNNLMCVCVVLVVLWGFVERQCDKRAAHRCVHVYAHATVQRNETGSPREPAARWRVVQVLRLAFRIATQEYRTQKRAAIC